MGNAREPVDISVANGGVLRVTGELDLASAPLLERSLFELASEPDAVVCLDLRGVTFMDSTAVHTLAKLCRHLAAGHVILMEPTPSVRRLLAIVQLAQTPNIHIV